jgi:membrane protein involved in colicin uptake
MMVMRIRRLSSASSRRLSAFINGAGVSWVRAVTFFTVFIFCTTLSTAVDYAWTRANAAVVDTLLVKPIVPSAYDNHLQLAQLDIFRRRAGRTEVGPTDTEEARKAAELEQQRKQEEARKAAELEQQRKQEEARKAAELEQQRRQEEEARKAAELEQQRKQEEARNSALTKPTPIDSIRV